METFTLRNVSFSYPRQQHKAINDLSLSVEQGEFLVLCGPSGCGKSTLLRQLKPVLTPHGSREGEILFEGQPLDTLNLRSQSQRIGFVGQHPQHQSVTDKVWHELAFGLESLGCDTPTIRRRVAEMASFFGMEDWFDRDVAQLSGGQKQLLHLASVMAMSPSVLILDEPTSQLDPIAASDLLATLGKIHRELGTTIFLTEHRLEEAFPLADRVAVMDRGRLLSIGTPKEVGLALREFGHDMFLAMPTPMRVWAAVENDLPCPITPGEGRGWLDAHRAEHPLLPLPPEQTFLYPDQPAISAEELWFKYERDAPWIVKGLSFTVKTGEFFALLGGNGTGKTTTLRLIAGAIPPFRGKLHTHGRVGLLPQDPQTLFVKKTLGEDLLDVWDGKKSEGDGHASRFAETVALCRLEGLLDRHPYDLSGGEQQRAALAKVLLLRPEILLLDEPTKGLDAAFKQTLAEILQALSEQGVTILMVSHDVEFCAMYAHRCALFFDGSIVTEASPRAFFSGNHFYTTSANRMARALVPGAVTAEELIAVCGGSPPPVPSPPTEVAQPTESDTAPPPTMERERSDPPPPPSSPPPKKKPKKHTLAATLSVLLLIPLTLLLGGRFLPGEQYYLTAVLILLECMLPFFLLFEGRKPRARELVVIAVLCAINVAGRGAFFMLPNFKPTVALTVIAGAALGGETGFLVGAMTMLASNVMFSQGPWTPWQMFAMGIIGFLAGLLFHRGPFRRERLPLCIFGTLATVVIYGGIMNPASVLIWAKTLDPKLLLTSYLTGFPMDCVHGVSTWLFLWFAARPMLEKLERIKLRYG